MTLATPVMLLLLGVANTSPPTIAHCRDHNGTLIFTDPPCPSHSTPIEWQGKTMTVLEFVPSPSTTFARENTGSKQGSRAHQQRRQRKQECQRVKSALKKLRGERRRGYRLADAAKLDDQLTLLKTEKRKFC